MDSQSWRNPAGGVIDRTRTLGFKFNGRSYTGHAGDTLASALLANGVRIVGRSFKYHRPRGIFGLGGEEPNALVQLGEGARTEPNSKATQIELHDALVAASQNCWPSVEIDLGAAASLFAPLLPAGFYYKTFMWPPGGWRSYERLIRMAAGMGRAPTQPDPDRYDHCHAHCDVLVIGGGPAGLAAALGAGRTGARVILVDDGPEFGGTLRGQTDRIGEESADRWIARAIAELAACPAVTLRRRATAFGYYDHNQVAIVERVADHRPPDPGEPRQRIWHVCARQVVLATGAIERSLLFENNDRPGIMLASAARGYINRYAVRPGRRATVFTNNDSAYRAALDLHAGGVEVAAIVDVREVIAKPLIEEAESAGIESLPRHAVARAKGGRGLAAVTIAALKAGGEFDPQSARELACDLLCVSGGWSPAVHLHAQARGRPVYDEALGAFVPGPSVQSERSVGAAKGSFSLAECLAEGFEAGMAAAAAVGFQSRSRLELPVMTTLPGTPPASFWFAPPFARREGKRFVDLQEDVTDADVALAVREGYRSVEHVKRYTTLGMGTDQGKTSNIGGFALIAHALRRHLAEVGTTTFRPPYTPVTLGALAGTEGRHFFAPSRLTPMHELHVEAGAIMAVAGNWLRPQYYPRAGEDPEAAAHREALAVRRGVGMVDVSTLGKIELFGRHAAEFLDRIYINGWASLKVGRGRYGIMLREDGMVFDDGTTSRLGEQHFFMTTTTGQAADVWRRLEYCRQVLWPELDVHIVRVTDQWGAIALAGPASRNVLAKVIEDLDIGNYAFPYMAAGLGKVAGVPARVLRVSFSGDLAYEIYAPANRAAWVWEALLEAGAGFGIGPYGIDALNILRIEKGHVTGAELNGRTTAEDLGFGRMMKTGKDFIGRRSLSRPALNDPARRQLVGLVPVDGTTPFPRGAQIVSDPRQPDPVPILGELTSACRSPMLGTPIGLALLSAGRSRHGERLVAAAPMLGAEVPVVVTSPVFFDPKGERLRA